MGPLLLIGILLVAVLVWLTGEVRSMHADLQPIIDSPLVQGLAAAGT